MELAHPLDDGLAALLIGGDAEARILGGQAREGDAHLLLVGLGLGLDRDLDDRIGELHPLEDDRRVRRAQRVAGGRVLEAHERDDVAGKGFLDVLAVVGVHQQHAADLLLLVLDRVDHGRGAVELARIDAGEGQGADERVGHDLEGESGERRIVVGRARVLGLAVQLDALDRGHVERARQIVDDRVEHRLHALVLERRAGQHRHEREVERALADQLLQRRDVGLVAFEIGLHDRRRPARRPSRSAPCGRPRRRPSGRRGSRGSRTWRRGSPRARRWRCCRPGRRRRRSRSRGRSAAASPSGGRRGGP